MTKSGLVVGGAVLAVAAVGAVAWLALSGPAVESGAESDAASDASGAGTGEDGKTGPSLAGTGRVAPKEAEKPDAGFKIRGRVVDASGAVVAAVPVEARRTGRAWDGSQRWDPNDSAEASFRRTIEGLDAQSSWRTRERYGGGRRWPRTRPRRSRTAEA